MSARYEKLTGQKLLTPDFMLKDFIKPEVCILAMLGFGTLFFLVALLIDYIQQIIFRRLDGVQRNAQVGFTLPPDEDVLKEERSIREARAYAD